MPTVTAKPNKFKRITDEIVLPLDEIAKVIGRSYQTVLAYRNGAREAPPEVFDRLADFIEEHQHRLPAVARLARRYGRQRRPPA